VLPLEGRIGCSECDAMKVRESGSTLVSAIVVIAFCGLVALLVVSAPLVLVVVFLLLVVAKFVMTGRDEGLLPAVLEALSWLLFFW